jgi:hypothetical protein
MDPSFRYPVIVQVVIKNGYDTFYGYCPDFGLEIFEAVRAGDVSQEYMFHLKLRRHLAETLTARSASNSVPPIRPANQLTYSTITRDQDIGSNGTQGMVSTSKAAEMLGVHPDTIRSLFDSGTLKGTLSKGGQRMISLESLQEEEGRMVHRAELRKHELRAKKKNIKRKNQRLQKEKEAKLERFREIISDFSSS